MKKTVASKVPFVDLCKVLQKINEKQGSDRKKKVLGDFISEWRKFHGELHKDPNTDDSFYPALRLLLPQFDKERGAYGIKEHTLAKLYIEILNLSKDSEDAQKLINYKVPKNAKADAGDFASVAYFVLKNRCPDIGVLKIDQVNAELDGVALNNANKNRAGMKEHLMRLLRNTSPNEQKWLIRMIMKDLKCGLSDQTVLNTFHPDAKDLYDVTNNLIKVATTLKNPSVRLHEIDISLFAPFRPMLAERAEPSKIERLMQNRTFYVQTKLDGERMQLHKNGTEYKYFSRNGNDFTQSYGATATEGNFTPYIIAAFCANVSDCILDGEMVGYNVEAKCIGSKGENFDVKALTEDSFYRPCFCVFDILMYNGKVLSNLPLRERLTYLTRVFKPIEGRLQGTPSSTGTSKQNAIDALNLAIDNREEGIVVKDPESVYRPNTRKGGWFKLKPEYVDGLMDELDLLIIGGYYGQGHRRGIVSQFLLAVAAPAENPDDHPQYFYSVARVGTGYSLQELYELCKKLNDHWTNKMPSNMIVPSGKEKPDLWIDPSKSHIVQVKAAEIVASNQFKTGCTLRFPRVEKVRYDKSWHECMTTIELEEMKKLASGKLSRRHMEDDDGEEEADADSPKKKARTVKIEQPLVLAPHLMGIDASSVTQVSQLLKGQEFHVINGVNHSKREIEKLIVQHGGSIVQNPLNTTRCILVDTINLKVNNIIKAGLYDVVKTNWLLRCIDARKLLLWTPFDMIHKSPSTVKNMISFDEFGDSYVDDTSPEQLKALFSSMPKQAKISSEEIVELEYKYFPDPPLGFLRNCKIYVDWYAAIGDSTTKMNSTSLELIASELRLYGAQISEPLDEDVTHVVVNCSDLERVAEFMSMNRKRTKRFHLVTEKWARSTIDRRSIIDERPFQPSP